MSSPNIASRFDEIYDATRKTVLTLITAKCNTADIKDIFQETYMALYKTLGERGADYVKNEKAFVIKIAKNKIARHYSLRERLRNFVSLTAESGDGEVDLSDYEAERFLAEDFTVNFALMETLRQFMDKKPESVQKVFYLTYDMGLTIAETARALGLSESNVKNKLYRTLKELRALLSEEGEVT